MAINRVGIKDFMAFKGDFACNFRPGVNIFIGGNGTGKTTLLKCLYIAMEVFNTQKRIEQNQKHNFAGDYFLNLDAESYSFTCCNPDVDWRKGAGQIEKYVHCTVDDANSVKSGNHIFIPAKDILEHSKGLLALNNKREIPFDQTYIDILSNAEIGETHTATPNASKALDAIKKVIGGEVLYENDTFYIVSEKGKTPFSLEASGYRKLGLLWKLLRNGLLEKGSALFWDEPENSLNPEIIPVLVDVLFELRRGGVQVFIATHSYSLARWFDVKRSENSSGEIMFYNLSKSSNGGIECVSAPEYAKLPESVLDAADEKLFKAVVASAMGVQGVE
ncbi:MAG: ATP-binding protein [Clostridiales bacterium]|jgi:AAA15 family ATPase/GTPase|nr:ATP-binding protein [Clostridiales bacterium]